jgi:hypothetical protein
MDAKELREQSVALLPGREALGRGHGHGVNVTIAKVHAFNAATAVNWDSPDADATALAGQLIIIK